MFSKLMRLMLNCMLVASLLVNQSLCTVHAHAGSVEGDSGGHENRPHIHFGFHHAHAHGHSPHLLAADKHSTAAKPRHAAELHVGFDHDADAFYLAPGASNAIRKLGTSSSLAKLKLLLGNTAHCTVCELRAPTDWKALRPPLEPPRAHCALYLLHLAIRC